MNSRLLAVGPTTTRSGRLRPNRATPSHGNGTFALHGTGVVPTPAEPPSTAGRTAAPVLGSRTGAAERPPRSDVVVHRELLPWLWQSSASDGHGADLEFHRWGVLASSGRL